MVITSLKSRKHLADGHVSDHESTPKSGPGQQTTIPRGLFLDPAGQRPHQAPAIIAGVMSLGLDEISLTQRRKARAGEDISRRRARIATQDGEEGDALRLFLRVLGAFA
jgi:hypothetical protein